MTGSVSALSYPDLLLKWLSKMFAERHEVLLWIGVLWGIQLINSLMQNRLCVLGVMPRRPRGLVGIVFSPFIHGSWSHLMMNTVPLYMLMSMLIAEYGVMKTRVLSAYLIGCSGGMLWLFGNYGLHVGASGLIMAYIGFLLFRAFFNPSAQLITVAVLVFYYCGGSLLSIFPQKDKHISYLGHLAGLLSGALIAYLVHIKYLAL